MSSPEKPNSPEKQPEAQEAPSKDFVEISLQKFEERTGAKFPNLELLVRDDRQEGRYWLDRHEFDSRILAQADRVRVLLDPQRLWFPSRWLI